MHLLSKDHVRNIISARDLMELNVSNTDMFAHPRNNAFFYIILRQCRLLQKLNVDNSSLQMFTFIPAFKKGRGSKNIPWICEHLTWLSMRRADVEDNTHITEESRTNRKTAALFPKLTYLDISECNETCVEMCGFANVVQKLTHLVVSNESVGELVNNNHNLESLRFRSTTVTDFGLVAIFLSAAKCAKTLTYLDLRHCKMTAEINNNHTIDDAIERILSKCTNLTHLSLSNTDICFKSLNSIAKYCKLLTALEVSRCNFLEEISLAKFVGQCKTLRYFSNKRLKIGKGERIKYDVDTTGNSDSESDAASAISSDTGSDEGDEDDGDDDDEGNDDDEDD